MTVKVVLWNNSHALYYVVSLTCFSNGSHSIDTGTVIAYPVWPQQFYNKSTSSHGRVS